MLQNRTHPRRGRAPTTRPKLRHRTGSRQQLQVRHRDRGAALSLMCPAHALQFKKPFEDIKVTTSDDAFKVACLS